MKLNKDEDILDCIADKILKDNMKAFKDLSQLNEASVKEIKRN